MRELAALERTNEDLCTPQVVIDVVRQVGPIGLDPCSNPWSIVPARVKLSRHRGDDGLMRPWDSIVRPGEIVFLNPPYSREIAEWAKLTAGYARLGVEIIALVRGDWSTAWWRTLLEEADAIAYWHGRLRFLGGKDAGTFASALVYFGGRVERFAAAARPHADVRRLERVA